MTPSPTGSGTYNWSGYSNPAVDKLGAKALATVDPVEREKLMIQCIHMVTDDVAFMPIYMFRNVWAARKGVVYDARSDELTLAMDAHIGK
jgi:peptide/nickel transport system substrate-binding protein